MTGRICNIHEASEMIIKFWSETSRPYKRPRHTRKDNIKTDLRKVKGTELENPHAAH